MNEPLKINPLFESVIPELTADEFAQLEENILMDGKILNPIIVWNGVIVDGHNRYKIATKHPQIQYSTFEKRFSNDEEAIVWICSNQLGRRNITESQRQYLIGKRYNSQKVIWGGDRKSKATKSSGGSHHLISRARDLVAAETNTTPNYVRNADLFAKGVDAAEEVLPGIKKKILSEEIAPFKQEIYGFSKLPVEERLKAAQTLLVPISERNKVHSELPSKDAKSASETEEKQYVETQPPTTQTKESKIMFSATKNEEIEVNILGSMQGSVDLFISTYNNYFVQFPKIRTEAKYRKKAVAILVNLKKYIEKVEGELQ